MTCYYNGLMFTTEFLLPTAYRPVLSLLAGVCVAVGLGFYFVLAVPTVVAWVSITIALVLFRWQQFFVVGIFAGIAAMSLNTVMPYTKKFSDCSYQAVVKQADYSRQNRGGRVTLAATDIRCKVADTVANTDNNIIHLPNQTIQYWDNQQQLCALAAKQLTVSSQLQPVRSRLNPITFDYERYLISQGIRLAAKSVVVEEVQAETWGLPLLRHQLSTMINQHLSADNAAIILALLTGNRSKLSGDQRQIMQATGTSHILAISGLHLALVGGLAWIIGQMLWALSSRLSDVIAPIRAGAVVALLVISGYAVLTGFNLPVQRAWIMFSLMIIAWLVLKPFSEHSLLLAAIVVILVNPYALLSIGFYYSFIATYIVLWCVRLPHSPLIKIIVMQLLINLTLLPLTWWAFGVVSFSAFFVNLLIIPWLGLWVLPWALLACLTKSFSQALAQPLWTLLDNTTAAMWQVITYFEHLPLNVMPDYRPLLWVVIVVVLSILLAMIYRKWLLFCGFLVLFLPLTSSVTPTMIVADSRYTSVLIHNGRQAIVINPGYHYQQRNDVNKWRRYLQQYQLSLAAIVLQNEKLTHISATVSLLKYFPDTKVITLSQIDLPYEHHYCVPIALPQLALVVSDNGECNAQINWYNQSIALFPKVNQINNSSQQLAANTVGNSASLFWQRRRYNAQQLGAVSVKKDSEKWRVAYERQIPKLWRVAVVP